MSLLSILDIGKSAIYASQTGLNVTAHNIANVNTPGYSRQEVVLEITPGVRTPNGFLGRGVNVSTVRRHYDNFVQTQLLGQRQNRGRATSLSEGLVHVEQVFNEAHELGLTGVLTEFFNAWHDVANDPTGQAQRTVLLQKARDLTQTAKTMERELEDVLLSAKEDIKAYINTVNSIAEELAGLNKMIAEAGNYDANDLKDERDRLMGDLSDIVGFSYYEGSQGMTIVVGERNLVEGPLSNRMEWDDINGLVKIDGFQVVDSDSKGRMGGFVKLKDIVENTILQEFRTVIATVIEQVNTQHRAGFGLDGVNNRDFFVPADPWAALDGVIEMFDIAITDTDEIAAALPTISATFSGFQTDNLETVDIIIDGVAVQFEGTANLVNDATAFYNALIAVQDGGEFAAYTFTDDGAGTVTVTKDAADIAITGWGGDNPFSDTEVTVTALTGTLTDTVLLDDDAVAGGGAADTDADITLDVPLFIPPPGNNRNALEVAELAQSAGIVLDYKAIVTNTGSLSGTANEILRFEEVLLADIQQRRDSVSSVSLDEEAINIIKFQHAFEAGARLIAVTDELMGLIISLV